MKRLYSQPVVVISLFFMATISSCMAQGVKGGETRRHSISLSRKSSKPLASGKIILFTGCVSTLQEDTELAALFQLVSSFPGYFARYHAYHDIRKDPHLLDDVDIAWIHLADSACITKDVLHPGFTKAITGFLEKGGGLLLTLEGIRLLNAFGLEEEQVVSRWKPVNDEGYGRKLGFHAYRDHPLFTGMYGGAYVLAPSRDTNVRINGFFGDAVPSAGRVVAVDWDHIFLRESSKLILEYSRGKGKILAIGGYLHYSWPNANRVHLERLTRNALDYMNEALPDAPEFYWNCSTPRVTECEEIPYERERLLASVPRPTNWDIGHADFSFPIRAATSNYGEVAGERILIMTNEKAGIEEIWTHPFMAIRDLQVGILIFPDGHSKPDTVWLSNVDSRVEIRPDAILRFYRIGFDSLTELVVADPEYPNGVLHVEYSGDNAIELIIRMKSNVRFMWPYSANSIGSICYMWNADYNAVEIFDGTKTFHVMVGGNKPPLSYLVQPEEEEFALQLSFRYLLHKKEPVDFLITGGSEGRERGIDYYELANRNPEAIFRRATHHYEDLFQKRLMITSPDQDFNVGYRWALIGTDRFFVHTPEMGTALVAGYATTRFGWDGGQQVSGRPGYAWYFGRAGQWSSFAVLDYGDLERVKTNLEFYLRFQDLTGKIFNEATTSGVIHYDAADATPLFVALMGRYFRFSGDTAFIRQHWVSIKKAIDFCFSTDTDNDRFIENTDVGPGWVKGDSLFGCHSSLYLQGCWVAALQEAGNMAAALEDRDSQSYQMASKEVSRRLEERFWVKQLNHYGYGLNKDGSLRADLTIFPVVPAYFGALDKLRMDWVLRPYASNSFSTNWGVRILDESNPLFKPTGNQYGSVWPLFTGWTALAEYKYHHGIQGFTHSMNNLMLFREWGEGYAEEVLSGATYSPAGVCAHQCWSETMVLQPVIEGMLGLDVLALENKIILSPNLPAHWDSLGVEHIRMGNRLLDMYFSRDSAIYRWYFHPDSTSTWHVIFMPLLPPGTVIQSVTIDGKAYPFTTFATPRNRSLLLNLSTKAPTLLEVHYAGGISILPLSRIPVVNEKPEGTRILDAYLQGNEYIIEVEGIQGSQDTLEVWHASPVDLTIQNGKALSSKGALTKILVDFPVESQKRGYQSIILTIKL